MRKVAGNKQCELRLMYQMPHEEISFHLAGCRSNQQERTPSTKCQRGRNRVTARVRHPDSLIGNPLSTRDNIGNAK